MNVFRKVFRKILPPPNGFRRALSNFSSEAKEPVVVPAGTPSEPEGRVYDCWKTTDNGHKWIHYFEVYEQLFAHFKNAPIRILEIGVYKGGSLETWCRALPAGSTVLGIDINQECTKFAQKYGENEANVRIGDQSDRSFLQKITQEFGPFDVIIDDGSHLSSHIIKSFTFLFPNALRRGGLYLVEDTHACYWASHQDQAYTGVAFFKDLVDVMHRHYKSHNRVFHFLEGSEKRLKELVLPAIAADIKEIRFLDSMVVVHKHETRSLPTVKHL